MSLDIATKCRLRFDQTTFISNLKSELKHCIIHSRKEIIERDIIIACGQLEYINRIPYYKLTNRYGKLQRTYSEIRFSCIRYLAPNRPLKAETLYRSHNKIH